ncbi:MAG TPA: cell division protein SepF [Pseudonocardia sp.]|jgi:cell division inhibitor SepF|uniref:cell division protein SepF n=1 Tax=Pseudonocardia sp. TaxID=60912 RepID=UPI002EDA73E3
MSALYRLKAYFGMVPAEDMDAYLDYEDESAYYDDRRGGYAEPPPEHRAERPTHPADRFYADRHHADRQGDRQPAERGGLDRALLDPAPSELPAPRGASGTVGGGRAPMTRGALAVEPLAADPPMPPASLLGTDRAPAGSSGGKELPLSRITTVHPRSYNEARTIGERYRDGIPVIMNLTELDDAAAKRLVDFAAGLAFALRGSIDKVTNRVFLLSPMGVEVSAEDRRKLAERGFFGQD